MPDPLEDTIQGLLESRFRDASSEARHAFRQASAVQHYAAGAVLCTQGEREERFAIVVDGQLEIYMDQDRGRTFVATLDPGRSLGGLEYITGSPRVADAVASGPVTVLEISFEALDRVVQSDPEILRAISAEIVTELLASQDRFIHLSAAETSTNAGGAVFVSYARADVEFAKELARGLRRLDVAVWLDVYNIEAGRSWARQIGEALDRCRAMAVVVSPASIASENSDDEWNYYLDKKKPVVPVLLEPVDMPYRLNKLQYVDFSALPFDAALTQLCVAIRTAIAGGAGPPTTGP
ncbi:MAG: TIR domain-containing protein [Acidimicrobiia bacterium]|jgi:CRP-like cAMP-binding protein